MDPMYDAQDEIERLKQEVERLQKQIATQQSVANLPQSLIDNLGFITDLARYAEGVVSEQAVKKKYRFDDATWARLGDDEQLVEAIEAEKARRVRNGSAKREKAQQHIVKAPDVLEKIMNDDSQNSRHRVDAIKALDSLADNGPRAAPEVDKFIIRIDLTADAKLKSTEPDPKDVITIEATPLKTPAAVSDQSDDWKKW